MFVAGVRTKRISSNFSEMYKVANTLFLRFESVAPQLYVYTYSRRKEKSKAKIAKSLLA